MATIISLDDLPTVVIPLQYVPFASHPRVGAITYRGWAIANGEVKSRDGEDAPDLTTLNQALVEVDLAGLVEARGHFLAIRTALTMLGGHCAEGAGPTQPFGLERLPSLVEKILKLLDGAVTDEGPVIGHRGNHRFGCG
jgi:type VI secretion system protein ImpA